MDNSILVSFILSIVLIAIFFLFSLLSYKEENNKKYDFRCMFPYELNSYKNTKDNIFGKISLVLSLVLICYFFIAIPSYGRSNFEIQIPLALFATLSIISSISLFFIPFKFLKLHLVLDIILFVSLVSLTLSLSFYGLEFVKSLGASEEYITFGIIIVSVCLVLLIPLLILIFNPKLKNWSKLVEIKNDDGTFTYNRPKWFTLAYTEWIFIAYLFLDMTLAFVIFLNKQ
jgi:hypothetical protein